MATKAPTKPVTTKPPPKLSPSRAVANWDEELAKQAEAAAEAEASTQTGAMFSLKAGILSWNDAPLQNNEVACIVVDSILENIYYDQPFDDDNRVPPTCFAFGRTDDGMKPHQTVFDHKQEQHDVCKGCQWNAYGTADRGKGKACRNIRRLALIPAGSFDKNGKFEAETDPAVIEKAAIGFMKIPVTSTTGWAAHVKQLAATSKKPPWGIFTRIKVVPDAKSQFKVTFEALEFVPNKLMGAVMARHTEAMGVIEQPYNLDVEQAPAKPAGKRGAVKTVVKGKRKF